MQVCAQAHSLRSHLNMKNPYEALGIKESATQDEIKDAYRNAAKKFHPDLNPGNKRAEAKFKELNAAYELLESAEKRKKFDEEKAQPHQDYRSPFGDDIFEQVFRRRNRKGEDEQYILNIDFKDSILGAEREINLQSGRRLQVKIPAGIESGAKLRFRGQAANQASEIPGDAFVEIHVLADPKFRRTGNNIESTLPISFMEALLGAAIEVSTLRGAVLVTIPPGVTTGSLIRIRGKGVITSTHQGDQLVKIKVMMPKEKDPALESAVKEWQGKYSYNPRAIG